MLLEGDAEGVAERAARLAGLLGTASVSARPAAVVGAGPAAAPDGTVLRIAFWAGRLEAVLAAIRAAAAITGVDPAVGGSAAAGVLHAALPDSAPPNEVTGFVTALRAELRDGPAALPPTGCRRHPAAGAGTSVVVLHAPPAVREAVDVWGPVPALALMRAVKDQFDPEHRLAPGRFPGRTT